MWRRKATKHCFGSKCWWNPAKVERKQVEGLERDAEELVRIFSAPRLTPKEIVNHKSSIVNRQSQIEMSGLGKVFILVGGILLVLGVALVFSERIPFLGKLPGDIHIKKDNFEVYIPLATSILLSLVISGVFWLISHFDRRS